MNSTFTFSNLPARLSLLDALPPHDYCSRRMPIESRQPQGLVDILDKILDKGLVVAGDIKVSLANVELLTIQLRLVICSIDKAEAIGINWWRSDRFYSAAPNAAGAAGNDEYDALKARVSELEQKLEARALPRATQTKADERKGR
ncbi:MAG TPA: gas vesicle protein [Thermoanaerobaculia bacterium]